MKPTRHKIADQTEKKNSFPYANGKYIGNGIRLKSLSQMEGLAYTKEETFEQAVLKGKDLPVLCDSCAYSKETHCPYFKIDRNKFKEMQEFEYCSKYLDSKLSDLPSVETESTAC